MKEMRDLLIDFYLAILHSIRKQNVQILYKKEKGYGRNLIAESRPV